MNLRGYPRILNLKNDVEKLEKEKSELSRKNEQLKVATQFLSNNDENGEAKQKIDFLKDLISFINEKDKLDSCRFTSCNKC